LLSKTNPPEGEKSSTRIIPSTERWRVRATKKGLEFAD
jgi:hypothetical protein